VVNTISASLNHHLNRDLRERLNRRTPVLEVVGVLLRVLEVMSALLCAGGGECSTPCTGDGVMFHADILCNRSCSQPPSNT